MRFTTLFTSLSLAVAAYAMPLVTRTENSVSSATDILNNLNSELLTISNDIRKSPLLSTMQRHAMSMATDYQAKRVF